MCKKRRQFSYDACVKSNKKNGEDFMNYELFKDEIEAAIKEAVERELGGEVKIGRTPKNNIMMDSLNYVPEGASVGVVVYQKNLYEQYLAGEDISGIVADHIQVFKEKMKECGKIEIMAKERIKLENVYPALVPRQGNEEYLENIPYIPFEDLAITFRISADEIGATMLVNDQMLDQFAVSVEELKEAALHGAVFTENIFLMDMKECINSMMSDDYEPSEDISNVKDSDSPMIIISNKNKAYGAGSILSSDAMEKVSQAMEDDLYILPSSVHECIAIPAQDRSREDELRDMVREINETQVLPEEVLSNQVYFYDSRERTLSMVQEDRTWQAPLRTADAPKR